MLRFFETATIGLVQNQRYQFNNLRLCYKNPFIFAPPKNQGMAKTDKKEESAINVGDLYTKTEMFVDKNRKILFGALGGVALLFVGFFGWEYLYKAPREEKAANAIWRAEQYFEIDSLDIALNGGDDFQGFEAIANEYSGTKVADRAHYYLGVIYREKGDFQTALDHFRKADFGDQTIGTIAMGNVGDMYVQLGNFDEAASWLEKAGRRAAGDQSRNFLAPVYMIKASKVYMELGKDDKAIGLLQNVTDDYDSKSSEYQEAAKLLAMLKARKG